MTPLQQAAQGIIDRWDSPLWKDQPHTAEYISALRLALDAEMAMTVEPVAWAITASNTGRMCQVTLDHDEVAEMNSKYVTPLYLHPPQQAREHRATEQLSKAFDAAVEVVGEHRVAKSLAVPSGERAGLIAELRASLNIWGNKTCIEAADMLEADAQQAKQVPLSDDQIDELAEGIAWDDYAHDLTRRVEKHHHIGGEA